MIEDIDEYIRVAEAKEAIAQREYATDSLFDLIDRYTNMWQGLTCGCAWAKLVEVKL